MIIPKETLNLREINETLSNRSWKKIEHGLTEKKDTLVSFIPFLERVVFDDGKKIRYPDEVWWVALVYFLLGICVVFKRVLEAKPYW